MSRGAAVQDSDLFTPDGIWTQTPPANLLFGTPLPGAKEAARRVSPGPKGTWGFGQALAGNCPYSPWVGDDEFAPSREAGVWTFRGPTQAD